MVTNFPKEGDNEAVLLKNSKYEQFDYDFALDVKKNHPSVWNKGGKKKGNIAFEAWTKVRNNGDITVEIEDWIKQREKYIAKNCGKDKLPNVVAMMKWGGVCEKGVVFMKDLIKKEANKDKTMKIEKTLSRKEMLEKSIRDAKNNNTEMPSVTKSFEVELKQFKDGEYRFIATKEIRDSDDEIVDISGGDFERYAKNPVWIWGHRMMMGDIYDVIGKTTDWKIELGEDGVKHLTFKPVYAKHQKAQDLKQMHEDGIATAISIGFRVKEYDFDTQTITSWELYEVSNVIVPANEDAIAYASSKGLISSQEVKNFVNEKVRVVNKKKLSNYRDLFLGKELLELLGVDENDMKGDANKGKEMMNVKKVYDLIVERLKTGKPKLENQVEKPAQPQQNEEVKTATVQDARELLKGLIATIKNNNN